MTHFEGALRDSAIPADVLIPVCEEIQRFVEHGSGRYVVEAFREERARLAARLLSISSVAYSPEIQCELAELKGRIEVLDSLLDGYLGLSVLLQRG